MNTTPRDVWLDDVDDDSGFLDPIEEMLMRFPLWVKVVLPLLAGAFVVFVIVTQLQQLKMQQRIISLKEMEIASLQRMNDADKETLVRLQSSMRTRYELFREIGVRVGVNEKKIAEIIARDPLVKP